MLQRLRIPGKPNEWEFVAPLRNGYFRGKAQIAEKAYGNAIIATRLPYFLMLDPVDFEWHQSRKSIDDVLTRDEFQKLHNDKENATHNDWGYNCSHMGYADVTILDYMYRILLSICWWERELRMEMVP